MRLMIERLPRKRGTPVRFIATLRTSYGYNDHVVATTLPQASRNDAARESNDLLRIWRAQFPAK